MIFSTLIKKMENLSCHRRQKRTAKGDSLFGGRGWIRTTEVVDGRFTVCSLWPLGNSSLLNFQCQLTRLVSEPFTEMELVNGLEPLTC